MIDTKRENDTFNQSICRGADVRVTVKIQIATLLSLIGLGLCVNCAKERVVNPTPRQTRIYAGGHFDLTSSTPSVPVDVIYSLETESLSKVDSILFDAYLIGMASSLDGMTLFVEVSDYPAGSDRVIALDASTHDLLWSFLGGQLGTILDSGRTVLLFADEPSTLVVDASTGTVQQEFGDSLEFFTGEYGSSVTVVSLRGEQEWRLRAFDTRSSQMFGGYTPRLRNGDLVDVRFAVLHRDGTKVLSIGRRSRATDSWFVVGDIYSDSTLLDHRMIYSEGEIAVSADGNWAVVTDPSNEFDESQKSLAVIDLAQMTVAKRFTSPEVISPGQVRFIGDELQAVTCPKTSRIGALQLIDIPTLSVTQTRWFPAVDTAQPPIYFFFGPFDVAPTP